MCQPSYPRVGRLQEAVAARPGLGALRPTTLRRINRIACPRPRQSPRSNACGEPTISQAARQGLQDAPGAAIPPRPAHIGPAPDRASYSPVDLPCAASSRAARRSPTRAPAGRPGHKATISASPASPLRADTSQGMAAGAAAGSLAGVFGGLFSESALRWALRAEDSPSASAWGFAASEIGSLFLKTRGATRLPFTSNSFLRPHSPVFSSSLPVFSASRPGRVSGSPKSGEKTRTSGSNGVLKPLDIRSRAIRCCLFPPPLARATDC